MERKMERSAEYPAFSLGDVCNLVFSLKDYVPTQTMSYEMAAKQLGTSINTSSFKYKLSAAKYFGFVSLSSGTTITFLEPATILTTEAEGPKVAKTKLTCFKTPKLYQELIKIYDGKALPTTKTLESILEQKLNIASKAKEKAAEVFVKSANEVGAIVNGVLNLSAAEDLIASIGSEIPDDSSDDIQTLLNQEGPETCAELSMPASKRPLGGFPFELPTLSGETFTLRIPPGVSPKDIDYLKNRLQDALPEFLNNLKEQLISEDE